MEITKQLTVIRFTQVAYSGRGRSRRVTATRNVWVESASFADGMNNGFKVKKIHYTTDRNKAAGFSLIAATEIAAQFYTSPATLERRDGTAMPEETAALRADCLKRNAQAIANRAEIAAEWASFWQGAPEELRNSLRSLGVRI